jgi:hypothetical protein
MSGKPVREGEETSMRRAVPAVLAAALVVATLTGCGLRADRGERAETGVELTAALGPEGTALAALGYEPADLAAADPVATGDPAPARRGPRWEAWRRRHTARVMLSRDLLHGEVVVETADGARTVLVQRGEVTGRSAGTVTVTSRDGFTQTWTYGDRLRVLESRTTVEPRELAVGAEVGVAGHERGGTPVANLLVIRGR